MSVSLGSSVVIEVCRPFLRRFERGRRPVPGMDLGRPMASILGVDLPKETEAVRINGEWFIRPNTAERRRCEDLWRATR